MLRISKATSFTSNDRNNFNIDRKITKTKSLINQFKCAQMFGCAVLQDKKHNEIL